MRVFVAALQPLLFGHCLTHRGREALRRGPVPPAQESLSDAQVNELTGRFTWLYLQRLGAVSKMISAWIHGISYAFRQFLRCAIPLFPGGLIRRCWTFE